jgi:hypothetical protein
MVDCTHAGTVADMWEAHLKGKEVGVRIEHVFSMHATGDMRVYENVCVCIIQIRASSSSHSCMFVCMYMYVCIYMCIYIYIMQYICFEGDPLVIR